MSTKTKKSPTTAETFSQLAQQAGLLLMSAAVTFGMTEMPDRANTRIVLPSQPVFAWANENEDFNNTTLRRSTEETEQQYISYSVTQRTPPRSGRQ